MSGCDEFVSIFVVLIARLENLDRVGRVHAADAMRIGLPHIAEVPSNILPLKVPVLGQRRLLCVDHSSLSERRVKRNIGLCQQNVVWVYHVFLLHPRIPASYIVEEILKLLVSDEVLCLPFVLVWNDLVHELFVIALLVLALVQVRPQRRNVPLMHLQLLLTQSRRLTFLSVHM